MLHKDINNGYLMQRVSTEGYRFMIMHYAIVNGSDTTDHVIHYRPPSSL